MRAKACIAIGNRVPGFSMSVGLQDVTLLLCTSLILFVFLCWLASVNQQCRAACVYFSEMCGAPAVTWMRWFVWTAAAHIKRKPSSVHFLSGSQAPHRNWIWASAFFQIILLCLCLPLTCCQLGNSQHPATLPPATSWCATVWVMSWINMLMYKGMSIGLAMR